MWRTFGGLLCVVMLSLACDPLHQFPQATREMCEASQNYYWQLDQGDNPYWKGTCLPRDAAFFWDMEEPSIQHTLVILRQLLNVADKEALLSALQAQVELDLSAFPTLTDLRPLGGLPNLRRLVLPSGAKIQSLAPLFDIAIMPEDAFELEADGVYITGTQPGDCPTRLSQEVHGQLLNFNAAIVDFCIR
ncbi:MAG: leucine-rich repeat domain-containing protein [Zetaproteobacteria bacterium]|nr:leucine-rich repeat domain-containing protein [Zetaproteobacteria bacterium]